MRNGVSCFEISSLIPEIFMVLLKNWQSQTVHTTVINHKIENISENVGWVLFKLGTSRSDKAQSVTH